MIPVRMHGVALLPPNDAPVMLLRETVGEQRWMAIWIGAPEANALLAAHQQVENPRPDTIELIGQVIDAFGRQVERVQVTTLQDNVFHADLILDDGTRISARPSDAVAIGLRAEAPIDVEDTVLAAATVEINVAEATDGDDVEQEIANFRARLDDVTPEDFGDAEDD